MSPPGEGSAVVISISIGWKETVILVSILLLRFLGHNSAKKGFGTIGFLFDFSGDCMQKVAGLNNPLNFTGDLLSEYKNIKTRKDEILSERIKNSG